MLKNFITQITLSLFLISAPYTMEAEFGDFPDAHLVVQLLVPEEKIGYIKDKSGLNKIDKKHHCHYMHISFLTIKDPESIIRKNFLEFTQSFNKLFQITSGALAFNGSQIKRVQSKNEKHYWCLMQDDSGALIKNCGFLQEHAKTFIKNKLQKNDTLVELAKGFPHLSIACTLNENDIQEKALKGINEQLSIDGFRFIYNFGNGENIKLPQTFVEKRNNKDLYNTYSQFHFTKKFKCWNNANAQQILNSINAKNEILEKLERKKYIEELEIQAQENKSTMQNILDKMALKQKQERQEMREKKKNEMLNKKRKHEDINEHEDINKHEEYINKYEYMSTYENTK